MNGGDHLEDHGLNGTIFTIRNVTGKILLDASDL